MNYLVELHNSLFNLFHGLTEYSSEFNVWVHFIADQLDWYVVLVAILFMILHRHKYRLNKPKPVLISRESLLEGVYIVCAVLIAWLVTYVMKIGFSIPRPFIQFNEIIPLFIHGGYDSFPSGHATLFAALATAIYVHHRRAGAIFVFCAFIIGIARVISGVHFPIDIVVGWTIGVLVYFVVYRLFTKYTKKYL